MEEKSVKRKVFSGLIWKFGERITAQLISLIVSIILARLLEPSDYGVIALVMIFITIANVFVSSGLGSALIQKKDIDNIDYSSVFFINLIFSIIIYIILFFVAPFVSNFYGMPILTSILRVLGIRIIVAAINSVQQAYVSRNMLFKRFFWSTLFGTLVSGVLGVILAYKGCGVWALVAQYLTNTCVDTIVLWFTVKWRPECRCSLSRAKGLVSYGWKLLVSSLLDTGFRQLRNLLIGKIYTKEDLAFYNQGDRFPNIIVVNINSSISGVLFPALSKSQNEPQKVKLMTRRAIQISSYILWPLMVGLGVCAEPFVRMVLTDKWLPCVAYIRVFCFSYGLWPIHTANLQAINAMGRSDIYLKLEIIKKIIGIIVLLITLPYGPFIVALGLVLSGILGIFINAWPNSKLLNYSWLEQMVDLLPSMFLAIIMGVVIYPLTFLDISNILILVMQILIGVAVYIILSVVTKQESFLYLLGIIRKKH